MKRSIACTAILLAAAATSPAFAGTHPEAGDWVVRARAIHIAPQEDSTLRPIGGKADFSNETVPEVDFSYFFTKNIAAELILATAKHKATAENTGVGTFDAGSAWVLPPTLTVQYHFTNWDSAKPYIGAGVNYTMYLDEKPGSQQSLKMDDGFGLALQAGVDVPLSERWSWNLDVKKLYVGADASWNAGAVTGDIDLDPWIIGTGIGYRF